MKRLSNDSNLHLAGDVIGAVNQLPQQESGAWDLAGNIQFDVEGDRSTPSRTWGASAQLSGPVEPTVVPILSGTTSNIWTKCGHGSNATAVVLGLVRATV